MILVKILTKNNVAPNSPQINPPPSIIFLQLFFYLDEPNCELCEQPLEIMDISASSKDAKKVAETGEPCIILDEPEFTKYRYNYSFLREFYHKNKESLDFSACEIFGDRGNQKLEEFFQSSAEDIMTSKQSFGWYVASINLDIDT